MLYVLLGKYKSQKSLEVIHTAEFDSDGLEQLTTLRDNYLMLNKGSGINTNLQDGFIIIGCRQNLLSGVDYEHLQCVLPNTKIKR